MLQTSVCAVIVTFNPESVVFQNIESIAAQFDKVIIVDNGSHPKTVERLVALELPSTLEVISNRDNLGIAAALNRGIRQALSEHFDWICTLDQDSSLSAGYVSTMLAEHRRSASPAQVALITPVYVDRASGVTVRLMRTAAGEILTTMTSGTMVAPGAIQRLGFFDETLFIDAVDTEFCLRARRQTMTILQSPAVLYHSLGRTTYYSFLGLRFGTTNHSADRRYYITRNRMRLFARYAGDWSWAWREGRIMIFDTTKIALLEKDRWNKFRAMLAGMADALSGKMGKQCEL
jgi:rhamnosyltransferase